MPGSGVLVGTVFQIGPIRVTSAVVVTWGIMLMLVALSWAVIRSVILRRSPIQVVVEGLLGAMEDAIRALLPAPPERAERVFPFIATLWLFVVTANLVGLIPGLHAPTGDLSVTAALAVLVFLSVHWFGVRIEGVGPYLRHYLEPSPLLLPFHLISEMTRTVTLAVRLFGNMMSLEMAALLVLLVAGLLAPIPLLMLHLVEALIQAYIFGMLALVYIAGGLQTHQARQRDERV